MIIEATITKTPNACRDVISVRGVCGGVTYPYYLDSYGISLNKASKLADSSMITAKALVEEAVDTAWGDVFSDLRIDGFKVNGVQRVYKTKFLTTLETAGTYTRDIERKCDIEKIYLGYTSVKVDGTLTIRISAIVDGTETVFYNDDLTDETVKVNIETYFDSDEVTIKVIATGAGSMYLSDANEPFIYDAYTECAESLFYCKYWNYLVKAVMYKATAHILNASLFSDRYNDLIVYKKDEIALRVAQLDSTFNLLNREQRINEKGLYQLEIININDKLKEIVKQSYCTCCFECDNVISSSISIP